MTLIPKEEVLRVIEIVAADHMQLGGNFYDDISETLRQLPNFSPETLIQECVTGQVSSGDWAGSMEDEKKIANNIREWFAKEAKP